MSSSNFLKVFLKINFLQVVIIDSDECQNDSVFLRNNISGLVVAFVAKYERYIVAHDAKEFQKTFRLGHGKVARQYRSNGQGKICEFNDVEPRKFHKAVYAVSAHKVTLPGDCHVVAMQLLAMT